MTTTQSKVAKYEAERKREALKQTINTLRNEFILEESFEGETLIIETFNCVRFGRIGNWNTLLIDHVNKFYKWDYDRAPKKMIANRILAKLKIESYTRESYTNTKYYGI